MSDSEQSEIELALIGTLIRAPEHIELASARLSRGDFFVEVHGRAFEHIVLLREAGKPVSDRRFVVDSMRSAGIAGDDSIALISRDDLLASVYDAVPANVSDYCDQIVAWSMLWAERRAVHEMQSELENRGANPIEICQRMQSRLEAIASRETLKTRSLYQHSKELVQSLRDSRQSDRPRGLPTGLPSMDGYIGGLVPGELTMICARPSHGKTALTMQMLKYNAAQGRRCLFVSLEMSGSELSQRMLSTATGISSSRMRSVDMSDEEITQLQVAAIEHREIAIEIYDAGKVGVRQVRALAKLMQSTGGVDIVAVDYLQIMRPVDGRKPTNEQIRDSAEGLKDLARELQIPVLCLAQLNRKAESERPSLSHIKGSGDAEQAADQVILIHNPKPENEDHNGERDADLILAKGRNVETGTIKVRWVPRQTEFVEVF